MTLLSNTKLRKREIQQHWLPWHKAFRWQSIALQEKRTASQASGTSVAASPSQMCIVSNKNSLRKVGYFLGQQVPKLQLFLKNCLFKTVSCYTGLRLPHVHTEDAHSAPRDYLCLGRPSCSGGQPSVQHPRCHSLHTTGRQNTLVIQPETSSLTMPVFSWWGHAFHAVLSKASSKPGSHSALERLSSHGVTDC